MENSDLNQIINWAEPVVVERLTDDHVYIYDHQTGSVFELSGVAAEFCLAINGRQTSLEILAEISNVSADASQMPFKEKVEELLQYLRENRLLVNQTL